MVSAAPTKAILFDFGGTLDADGVAWKERFRAYYGAEGVELADEIFDRHFYDADDPLVGRIPPTLGFDETVARLAANFESGLDESDPARGERVAARFTQEARDILARNVETLSALSERYQLGIVSNFYGNLRAVCGDTGIGCCFSVIVDSQEAGIEKPDRRIFEIALDQLDLSPAECLYVGDSLRRDRTGARNAGIPFVWLAPPGASEATEPIDHPVAVSVREIAGCLR